MVGPEVELQPESLSAQLALKEQHDQEELSTGIRALMAPPVTLLPLNLQPLGQISAQNTTIIGDRGIKGFSNPDSKWLVQNYDKAVFETITNRVGSGEITVARRYIFLMIGNNQIFRAVKTAVQRDLRFLITCIIGRNLVAKIFISGILPRPGKPHARQYVKNFNRYLAAAVKKIQKEVTRVFYIPVQIQFIVEVEHPCLFDENGSLNEFGRMHLKRVLLEGAGFISR